jgi:lysophospholipase L1-like esterase
MYKLSFRWLVAIIFVLGLFIMSVSPASAAWLKNESAIRLAATGDGSPGDSNIKYIGRWDNSNLSNVKSYWSGAYFRVNFTGTTVSIKLAATVNLFATIDGVTRYYPSANGTVNLTSTPLASGTHSLRVAARSEYDTIQFQGLVLSSGAATQAPATKNRLIEFIGDSITAGCCTLTNYVLDNYAWLTGEALDADHTQVAFSGICLQDAFACFSENNIGMSNQFFKLQTVHYLNSPAWDFNRYQPNQVVINLGTNDSNAGVSDSAFQNTYTTFLQNVRAKYPNAEIYVLRTFGGYKVAPTQAAVNARINAGDTKLRYVDTTGWVTTGDFDSDNLHPNMNGHVKIKNRLVSVLGTGPTPTNTPTSTPGTGPISINAGGSATGSFTADQYFSGGSTFTNTNTIDTSQVGSVPAAVFQSERYGAMTYTIPRVAGSAQTVTLYFAETYVTAAGQRLFNVSINGTTVLSSFDIFASAGGQNKAIARTFNTTANGSGQVVIQFTTGTENPKINGITVTGGSGPTPTPTKTPTAGPTATKTPTPVPSSNFLTNADMESGTTNWVVNGAGTLSSDTSQFHGGTHSVKITGRTANWNGIGQNVAVSNFPTSGQNVTVSVWVRSQTGTPTGIATLRLTASTTTYVQLASAAINSTGWTQLTATVPVSWSGTLTGVLFYVETAAGTDNIYIDDANLHH